MPHDREPDAGSNACGLAHSDKEVGVTNETCVPDSLSSVEGELLHVRFLDPVGLGGDGGGGGVAGDACGDAEEVQDEAALS